MYYTHKCTGTFSIIIFRSFSLPPTSGPTQFPPGGLTPKPVDPPVNPGDVIDPDTGVGDTGNGGDAGPDNPGGGVAWVDDTAGGGETVLVMPDGVSGTGVDVGGAGGGPDAPIVPLARVGAGGVAGVAEGARAGVVAGTFLGLLALASGIGWAFYKFKPGSLTGGGGGAGAGSPMNISAPTAGGGYLKSPGGGAAITISSANGSAVTGTGVGMAAASTQTPAGMGPAGSSSANFQMLTGGAAAGAGIAGVSTGRGTVTRPTQTDLFFVSGPPPPPVPILMQSASSGASYSAGGSGAGYSAGGSGAGYSAGGAGGAGYANANGYAAGYSSSSYSQQVTSTNANTGLEEFDMLDNSAATGSSATAYGAGHGGSSAAYGTGGSSYGAGYASIKTVASAETQTPDISPIPAPSPQSPVMYDAQAQAQNYQNSAYGADASSSSMFSSSYKEMNSYNQDSSMSANQLQAQSAAQRARTLSPPPDATLSSSYQMRNMSMMNASNRTSTGPNIFLAAEEIRVDCMELTGDGRNVVTGSIFGPPQVWDMRVSRCDIIGFYLVKSSDKKHIVLLIVLSIQYYYFYSEKYMTEKYYLISSEHIYYSFVTLAILSNVDKLARIKSPLEFNESIICIATLMIVVISMPGYRSMEPPM